MQMIPKDNFASSGAHAKDRTNRRLETLVSGLSRTSGYIALALGVLGVIFLLNLIF